MKTPKDCDFFIIGDATRCGPCRQALERLRDFVKRYPEFNFGKWEFDLSKKIIVDPEARILFEKLKEQDPEIAKHKTIPMVWVNSRFIGGRSELFKVLEHLETSL